MISKFIIFLFLINTFSNGQKLLLNLSTSSYAGPVGMGVNMGHAYLNSNWAMFLDRLGVNYARLFVTASTDLRNMIKSFGNTWGNDLNGNSVTNQASYLSAVSLLRGPNGRNQAYAWKTSIQWSYIINNLQTASPPIFGSPDNIVKNLNSLNIAKLFVLNIGCGGAATNFVFNSLDRTSSVYWAERWELYKFSYALAVLARNYGVTIIEYLNEPDLLLGACMNSSLYQDYYTIRSQSIQEAYFDRNAEDPTHYVSIQVAASALARRTFGGDPTQYLGDVSVNNTMLQFSSYQKLSNWSNMQVYTYHSYGKPGQTQVNDYQYLVQSVQTSNPTNKNIPVVITEHNSHTSSDWSTFNSTPDDTFEASRLASQIINLISTKTFTSHFVFKFSVTPSNIAGVAIAKNGLHWGEIYQAPYQISDTTLSAEAFRLLTKLKQSQVYPITINTNSVYIDALASNNGDGFFYLYIVNDYNTTFTAQFNLPPAWKISDQTQILVETVSGNFWGEISTITNTINGIGSVWIDKYSTTRLAIQTGIQKVQTVSATLSCTARAGVLSSQTYCSDTFMYSGTSNTAFHEQTTVSLLSFPLTNYRPNQRSVLKLMVSNIIGNQSTLVQVLGITNTSFSLNSNSASWNGLSNLLVPLNDGTLIGNISQNFINWSSPGSFSLAGHIVAANQTNNQIEMIDVTEYVNKINSLGGNQLNFLVYRPFRHPAYVNPIPVAGDNLSSGAVIKFYGANSANPPQISFYSNS